MQRNTRLLLVMLAGMSAACFAVRGLDAEPPAGLASTSIAGAITLSGECLKCHVPDRTDLKDRAAGLVISVPLK